MTLTQKWLSLSRIVGRPVITETAAKQAHRLWIQQNPGISASSIQPKKGRWYVVYYPGGSSSGQLDGYLTEYLADLQDRTTWDTFRNVRAHLGRFRDWCRVNGVRGLSNLTRRHVESFGANLPASLGATSRRRYLESVRAALNRAIDWGYLQANPAARIRMPIDRRTRTTRALSDDEIRLIESTWTYPDREFAMLGIWAGLRRREIVYLTWTDVDFDGATIAVTAKPEFGHAPKGTRYRDGRPDVIPMVPWLANALAGIVHEHRFVFDNGRDQPMLYDNTWWCRLKRAYTASGIENANLHTLRHTFATKCALAGIPGAVLSNLARHLNRETTERYLHASLDDARREIGKLRPVDGSAEIDGLSFSNCH